LLPLALAPPNWVTDVPTTTICTTQDGENVERFINLYTQRNANQPPNRLDSAQPHLRRALFEVAKFGFYPSILHCTPLLKCIEAFQLLLLYLIS
jgi:hypothetical protein